MRVANFSAVQISYVNNNEAARKFDIGSVYSFYGIILLLQYKA